MNPIEQPDLGNKKPENQEPVKQSTPEIPEPLQKQISGNQEISIPPILESRESPSVSNLSEGELRERIIRMAMIVGAVVIFLSVLSTAMYLAFRKSDFSESGVEKNEKGEEKSFLKGMSCEDSYAKLLEANFFDFYANCKNSVIRTGDFEQSQIKEKTNKMVIVFDSSGSMAGQINGKAKIDIAKDAAKSFIDKVASDKNFFLSIVVYGHKGGNSTSQKGVSCEGIEEIYYMGNVNTDVAKKKLDSFKATGWTPIASSMKRASDILSKDPGDKNFILLVSDGEETCGGNPIETAKNLKNVGFDITANVIGFDVDGKDEEQLKAISAAGGGEYFSAKNQQDLEAIFEKHKQMLNVAIFKINRVTEQTHDVSRVITTYNNCMSMLKKEETSMILDIHISKLTGDDCEEFSDGKYRERFNSIRELIEDNYKKDMETLDLLK